MATGQIQVAVRLSNPLFIDNAIRNAIVVAAMGFLHLIGENGLNIRSDQSTWFATLIIAHAWFNLSLVIRFCEPVLSTLDPQMEEQMLLLPGKQTW